MEEVKVTRKYQVTIPESVRTELGVKIGDKLIVKSENKKIIMQTPNHIINPSDKLWCLFGKPLKVDAVKLVEESWQTSQPIAEPKKLRTSKQKEDKT